MSSKVLKPQNCVYSSGHQGTFNPAVITNKEVHMVHGHINTNDETSHTTSNVKKRSLEISDYFSKPPHSKTCCAVPATCRTMECTVLSLKLGGLELRRRMKL